MKIVYLSGMPPKGIDWADNATYCFHYPHVDSKSLFWLESFTPAGHILLQTSGTTTSPKWVALSKRAILASAQSVIDFYQLTSKDKWLLSLPCAHIGGLSIVARAASQKAPLEIFSEKWSPHSFSVILQEKEIRVTSLVPMQLFDLVQQKIESPKNLRLIFVGGDALSAALEERARALGWPIIKTYGMSEAASQVASQRGERLQLLPHLEARVDEEAILSIKGSSLFTGYISEKGFHSPQVDGWFKTQDRVNYQPESRILVPLGRKDHSVKISGRLVDLESIERLIDDLLLEAGHPRTLFLTAEKETRRGHQLVLSYVGERPDALIKQIQEKLPPWLSFSRIELKD